MEVFIVVLAAGGVVVLMFATTLVLDAVCFVFGLRKGKPSFTKKLRKFRCEFDIAC
jgi:hypothetical protein